MGSRNGISRPWVYSLRGAAIYALFGLLWIFFSDTVLGVLVTNPERLTLLQTYKGSAYIVITAILVYWLLQKHGFAIEKSDKSIQDTEASLDLIFRALPLGVATAKNRVITSVNDRLCEITGYSREEIIGQDSSKFYMTEAEFERVGKAIYSETARTGVCSIEACWRHKTGRKIYILLGAAVAHEAASPTDVVLSIMDITEQHEKEALYRLLFEEAHDALFLMRGEQFEDCNASALRMYGVEREQLIGASPLQFSPERQPDGTNSIQVASQHITAALDGKPQVFEWRHLRGDGSPFDTEISLNSFLLGGKEYLLATVRNITERKQTLEALHASEERFKGLHNASFGGIAIHDKGVIQDCNQGLSEITGYSLEELTGMNGLLLIAEQSRDMVIDHIKSEYEEPYEAMGVRKNGEMYPLRLEGRMIPYQGKTMRVTEFRDITERKQAEARLRESEWLLKEAQRVAKLGHWVFDIRKNKLDWSDEVFRIFGLESKGCATTFESFLERVHPEDRELLIEAYNVSVEQHKPYAIDHRVVMPDKSIRFVHEQGETHYDEKGNALMSIGIVLDITERKQALEALQKNEEYLESIFRTVPIGIAVVYDRVVETINDRFCEIFGYTRNELVGDGTKKLYISEEEYQRCGKEIYDQLDVKGVSSVEAHMIRKDGREIHVLIDSSRLATSEKANSVISSLLDITALKQAEEHLRASEERFKALHNASFGGITIHDEGVILDCNQGLADITGYSHQELVGMNCLELVTEESRARVMDSITTESEEPYEAMGLHRNGEKYPLRLAPKMIPYKGKTVRVTEIRDISEQKRTEEELRTHRDKLEDLVRERTEKLTESNSELQRMIEASDTRSEQTAMLNEMSELLQACETEEETYRVAVGVCAKLFPKDSGCLGVLDEDNWSINVVGSWGHGHSCNAEFAHNDCWAIRRGKAHMVLESEADPLCRHVREEPECGTLCVPMNAQGKVLGMTHMLFDSAMKEFKESERHRIIHEKLSLLGGLVERYAPSLVNLRLRESLREQSIRDQLTGLFNRRHMEEAMSRELARAQRRGAPLVVVMIDVDHFKKFNDTYGHETGDDVLRRLGEFLTSTVRIEDIPCRYGGEELVLILPECSSKDGLVRAEDVRKGIEEDVMVVHDGERLQVTASLGVASFPLDGEGVATLIAAADKALYRAKEGGRNQVVGCS